MNIRVGLGYDVHKLEEGLPFAIGGITIPHHKGTLGHSDGDVLIHAICDALLGAANKNDIGYHFPDTDNTYKGIDSKILLKKTIEIIRESKYKIGNIDATVSLQKPKLKNHIPEMKKVLANTCQISEEDISIKATTTEKLGFEGREEGVSAQVVVLIFK